MGSLDPNAKKLDPYSIILSSTVVLLLLMNYWKFPVNYIIVKVDQIMMSKFPFPDFATSFEMNRWNLKFIRCE